MARSRFKPAERAVFVVGAKIEWRNGGHWHPAEIIEGIDVDGIGVQRVMIRHTGRTTRTVSTGETFGGYPGKIRVPTTA
jgi:hypothetical protein